MRSRLQTSVKGKLKMKRAWLITGGVAIVGAAVFIIFFNINFFGVQRTSKAAETNPSRYPFELSDEALRKVNFTALAPQVNSVFAEVRPMITADGKALFFCRRNHPDNVLREKDKQDIWVSTSEGDNQWKRPVNLGGTINSRNADAICSISPDGSEIIFLSDKVDPSRPLMKSVKQNNTWRDPEPIEIENFYNLNEYLDFYYSYEANVLLMAIECDDSRGKQDLYVSFPKGKNKWSEPVNLGKEVNSPLSDFAPFLSADGKTLYFSSYGHEGKGGCDIFQTTRLDDTWKNWSKAKNLGPGINSPREESYFSITGDYKYIYFESYVKDGVRDIFRADLPDYCKPVASQVNPVIVSNKDNSKNK